MQKAIEIRLLCEVVVLSAIYCNPPLTLNLLEQIRFPDSPEAITEQFFSRLLEDAERKLNNVWNVMTSHSVDHIPPTCDPTPPTLDLNLPLVWSDPAHLCPCPTHLYSQTLPPVSLPHPPVSDCGGSG